MIRVRPKRKPHQGGYHTGCKDCGVSLLQSIADKKEKGSTWICRLCAEKRLNAD